MAAYRLLTEKDVPAAAFIEKASLETAWSENQISEIIGNPNAIYMVAEDEGEIIGILSAYIVADDAEIINLAVKEAHRGKFIGTMLLHKAIVSLSAKGAKRVTLEVAEGNLPAEALYAKHGFLPVGKRKSFYRGKDAVVMEKML